MYTACYKERGCIHTDGGMQPLMVCGLTSPVRLYFTPREGLDRSNYFLRLPYRLMNLSTRPAVSTSFALPVKNG